MSNATRAFCFLSTFALIAGSIWLHKLGMDERSFLAICFVYPLGCMVLVGEAFIPLTKDLPRHPYRGESNAALARRELMEMRKLHPNSKWLANLSAIKAGLVLGFVVWVVLLAFLFKR